ncbi:MAG TPA: nuclear transport factor 2 family protein [Ilumatobacteraceae bacterium]|nr:nuclear transport factor 2 family protein [Ilumatobacteraceae bacterium]
MNTARPTTDHLADIEAIKQLKHRYWRACDGRDGVGFRACFIRHGARIDYGPMGSFDDVEPMARIFEAVTSARHGDNFAVADQHHGMMPEITMISATEAVGTWALQFRQVNMVHGTETTMVGHYDDRYVVEDGEWKIAACTCTVQWSITRPLGDATVVIN